MTEVAGTSFRCHAPRMDGPRVDGGRETFRQTARVRKSNVNMFLIIAKKTQNSYTRLLKDEVRRLVGEVIPVGQLPPVVHLRQAYAVPPETVKVALPFWVEERDPCQLGPFEKLLGQEVYLRQLEQEVLLPQRDRLVAVLWPVLGT